MAQVAEHVTGNMICKFEEFGPMCEMKGDAIAAASAALAEDDDSNISKSIKRFFDHKVVYKLQTIQINSYI